MAVGLHNPLESFKIGLHLVRTKDKYSEELVLLISVSSIERSWFLCHFTTYFVDIIYFRQFPWESWRNAQARAGVNCVITNQTITFFQGEILRKWITVIQKKQHYNLSNFTWQVFCHENLTWKWNKKRYFQFFQGNKKFHMWNFGRIGFKIEMSPIKNMLSADSQSAISFW